MWKLPGGLARIWCLFYPEWDKRGWGQGGWGMGQEKERRSKRAGGEVKGEGAKNKLNSKDKFVLVFKL